MVTAHYSEVVRFSPTFVIHNVLYIPSFNFNLVSISKLISILQCTLIFSDNFCEIQDQTSLRMIGLAKLIDGLYYLIVSKSEWFLHTDFLHANSSVATPITSSNIWHFRLEHLSRKRLNVLNHKFPFISKHVNELCDVCHLAKQRKLPYSNSASRASKAFKLIHLDIWGPFSKISVHGHKYFLTILDDFSRYT